MESELSLIIKAELIELSSDENMRMRFNEISCDKFWISIKSKYLELLKIA